MQAANSLVNFTRSYQVVCDEKTALAKKHSILSRQVEAQNKLKQDYKAKVDAAAKKIIDEAVAKLKEEQAQIASLTSKLSDLETQVADSRKSAIEDYCNSDDFVNYLV